jgi:DNA primase
LAFRELLSGAIDALEHKIRTATRGIDLARDTHRANLALEEILTTIARGATSGTIDAVGLRAQQLLARLARQFALDESDVRSRFNDLRRNSKKVGQTSTEYSVPSTQYEAGTKLQTLSADETELLEILVLHPELAPTALTEVAEDDLQSATALEFLQTYRRLEEGGHSLEFQRGPGRHRRSAA